MKRNAFIAVMALILLSSSSASAGVWFELLHAPCWTGDEDDIDADSGEYNGAFDCFNNDFNGDGARTLLSIKAFQAWEYGTMFMYYDLTGPFNSFNAGEDSDNERGGFFGGITVTLSAKQILDKFRSLEEPSDWGPLANLSFKYEAEHVSNFGMLHYYGLQWDFAVPVLDFFSATPVIRDDRIFTGVELQVGAAWQKSFSISSLDLIFGGFFQWGLFGEGDAVGRAAALGFTEGNSFFLTQPQLLLDVGKPVGFTPGKLYAGFEYQYTVNRYLIEGQSENLLQGMIRWTI